GGPSGVSPTPNWPSSSGPTRPTAIPPRSPPASPHPRPSRSSALLVDLDWEGFGGRHQLPGPLQIGGFHEDVHRTHRIGTVVAAPELPQHALGPEPGREHAGLELVEIGRA